MSYDYQAERDWLFTETGSRKFTKARDNILRVLAQAGAVRSGEMSVSAICPDCSTSWEPLTILDRMVEIGDLREITGPDVAGQHRVFVSAAR